MSSFKLEGDDAQQPPGEPVASPTPEPTADEFSFFLADDDAPKAQPSAPQAQQARTQPPAPQIPRAQPQPTASSAQPVVPVAPPVAQGVQRPAQGAAPSMPSRPANPQNPNAPRPQTPPDNTNAVKALPDLMRPAQRPSGPPANPSQPPGLNGPAAQAVTPVLTEPDAASIAQSAMPSDDTSSAIQEFGAGVAGALDKGTDIFTWVARVAFLVVGLSLAVLLAGIFLGNAANIGSNPKAADLMNFLLLATKGLTLGTLALAASLLLLSYDDNRLGAIVAGAGAAFYIAVPLGLRAVLGQTNPLFLPMAAQFFNIGKLILVIGLFKAFIDVALWLWNLPNQMKAKQGAAGAVGFGNPVESKQQKIARQANMFSPCWKLPFCREPIRVLCPAFLAKTTCWKFGRGCYCDTEMVGRIVRNEPLESIKAATTVQSQQPPPCGRCYIFLEHQTHKFRMMSPLVLPSAVLFMLAIWPTYSRLFLAFTGGYTRLFSSISFNSGNLAPDAIKSSADAQAAAAASTISPEEIAHVSSYMLGGLMGFFLLIYLSKFVEWAIFKAKW